MSLTKLSILPVAVFIPVEQTEWDWCFRKTPGLKLHSPQALELGHCPAEGPHRTTAHSAFEPSVTGRRTIYDGYGRVQETIDGHRDLPLVDSRGTGGIQTVKFGAWQNTILLKGGKYISRTFSVECFSTPFYCGCQRQKCNAQSPNVIPNEE
jgi:hypothetical protein